ncbi:MAG: carbohydrate porin [Verrucomicrobiota bacterium]
MLLCFALAGFDAAAQDAATVPAAPLFERETLTGEWFGNRPLIEERGVSLFAGYTAEVWGNVAGGLKRGSVYTGLLDFGAEVDLEKLAGWHGGSLGTTWLWLSGRDASEDLVGNFLTVSNIAGFNTLRMMELWFQQNLFDEKISLRFGNITADSEFLVSDFGGLFLNGNFGWPALASMNMPGGGAAYPVGGLGVRLLVQPTDWLAFRSGVFLTNLLPQSVNRAGFRWDWNSEQAVTWMNELEFRHGGEKSSLPPGFVKAGMWLQTGAEADAANPDSGLPNTGFYLLADQMLLPEGEDSEQGLGVFVGTGFTPPNRNVVDFYLNSGVTYKGLLPTRDDDTCGVALGLANQRGDGAEMVLEATYQCALTPWCMVQPDIQYVINPGANSTLANALVLGMRFSVVF